MTSSYIKFFEDFLQQKDGGEEKSDNAEEKTEQSSVTESVASNSPPGSVSPKKMEHSYIRDSSARNAAAGLSNGLSAARTILVRRPLQCGSCHTHPLEEQDLDDSNQAIVPGYNEIAAKEAMNECARIAKYVKNINSDDEDWESRVNQMGWSTLQKDLFEKVARILDDDQLGRYANVGRQFEPIQRRLVVDKSAARMRSALASVAWDTRMTQWLHSLLMDCLPATYMASYLDILQTLKSKVPSLMDKMLFGRPLNISQELLAPVMKKKWEPQVNTKPHNLQQNAVIVALPSSPTSGAIPSRLQKWYQQLASITQIVQITLPIINNHTNNQPLEHIAEQLVSLTRVKIQELRNENPMRSIILIGFNSGAALALQVAMSETVACVICMGFAYNTIKGVRGAPDDRILDLKVPILFVIGQNSARTSQEELEYLREKMQSDTSLVIVGSADDFLRVSKAQRQIENVSQTMVDAMVVDEVYEFIKRILTNPPGPRAPTSLTGVNTQKHGAKSVSTSGEKSLTAVQRKRKHDAAAALDTDMPVKTKFTGSNTANEFGVESQFKKPKTVRKSKPQVDPNQPKRKVGRPRTRPLPAGTTSVSFKSKATAGKLSAAPNSHSAANDDLNIAMQTLLDDTSADEDAGMNSGVEGSTMQTKLVTSYQLISPPKANTLNKSVIGESPTTSSALSGAKIKMIPSNQFLQIKPQQLQTQSKIYTIKTPPSSTATIVGGQSQSGSIGSIVRTTPNLAATGQQHIFTLKSPNGKTTQFVTAAAPNAQQKYTVVKNTTGGTMLQLTTAKNAAAGNDSIGESAANNRMDLSNIIDMPILFADNDGNLTDSANTSDAKLIVNKPSTSSGVGQLIISQKIIKEANTNPSTGLPGAIGTTKGGAYVINKSSGTILQAQPTLGSGAVTITNKTTTTGVASTSNKVVFINRNTMKPCPSIISRSNVAQNFPKYAKVVVSNTKTTTPTIVTRPGVQIAAETTGATTTPSISNISNVKQLNLQALKSSLNIGAGSGTVRTSVGGKPVQQFQILNSGASTSAAADKGTFIRNIMVKPGSLKQIPPHLTSQLINRNLTVRKLVNFVPGTNNVVATGAGTPATSSTTSPSAQASTGTSSMQTVPKIITLNPVNNTINSQTKSD